MMTQGAQRLRTRLPRRWIAIGAIVLTLVLACGGAAFLASPATAVSATGPSATVNAGGLVLTMRTAPGPYFLRELLPVSVSRTNHSNATFHVPRGSCVYGGALSVTEEGGSAPMYRLSEAPGGFISGAPTWGTDDLVPGQTCGTSDVMLPVTASGRVTLTAHAAVTSISTMNPFAEHEPTLTLTVAPSAPADRTLSLWRHTTRVVVYGPAGALFHLHYTFTASTGSCGTGGFGWVPLTLPVLDAHPCAGVYGTWSYAIGAPGYAIASETVSF